MYSKTTIVVMIFAMCFCSYGAEIDARLQKLLQRYPDADADKDGVLSVDEAMAYRKKITGQSKKEQKGYTIAPDYSDLKYGPYAANAMDLWLAKRDDGKASPIAIFIHGGGFKGGDKSKMSMGNVKRLLDAGISTATINYRLTDEGPFPNPMHDGGRAIQFLRYHAKKYNLDKERFACFGGSAGGCMSFWLAFHDDLADPDNADPVLRESTRLTCIAPNAGQPALEKHIIDEWFQCDNLQEHSGGRPLFGIKELDELVKPEIKALMKEASPLTHLSKDDPPVFMTYGANVPVDENSKPSTWVHHPIFGIKLKEIMDKMGMENYLKYKGGPKVEEYSDGVDFMINKLAG